MDFGSFVESSIVNKKNLMIRHKKYVVSGLRKKLRNCRFFGHRYQLALAPLSHISIIVALVHTTTAPLLADNSTGFGVPLQFLLLHVTTLQYFQHVRSMSGETRPTYHNFILSATF